MQQPVKFSIKDQTLWLSAESCLYWEEEQILIASDIHFGKSGHFRKEGIGIPQDSFKKDLQRLFAQIQFFKPTRLLIVGDFFHSNMNSEVLLFEKWRKDISSFPIHLVRGNHDILGQQWYKENNIQLHENHLQVNRFHFVHDLTENNQPADTDYIFSGHIHPGIHISGLARQNLRFPCFYFTKDHAVLPAFGSFTGLHIIKPKKADKVFAIVNKKIIDLSPNKPIT